jgi:homoserine O-acetyltransferase/O-succinyltransferase
MELLTYRHPDQFTFENGQTITGLEVVYRTYGTLSPLKDNIIWVCHALTGNADVLDWWSGLFGENDLFNPAEHYIVCANIIGSAHGSTNPLSVNPGTGSRWYLDFPKFTTRDLAAVHALLADHLGLDRIGMLIGGSLGGQQALEWAVAQPERFDKLVLIATNAFHSPWGIAFNESQRLALQADPSFYSCTPDGGKAGLKAARSIALLSYRNYQTYGISQQEISTDKMDDFKASSYQRYQGDKLVNRFNAYSYWYLTKAMDSHNVARSRDDASEVLKTVRAQTLVIGISSDVLFPPAEQEYLAAHIPGATYVEINSFYGHDGFLIETETLTRELARFKKKPAAEIPLVALHKIA